MLDHATDVLEQASISSPRKGRKSILELMESVEEILEAVDADWCDGVSRCSPDRLSGLQSSITGVQRMKPGDSAAECVSIVTSLMDNLRECGSAVAQCDRCGLRAVMPTVMSQHA